jgi:hypothetical protein
MIEIEDMKTRYKALSSSITFEEMLLEIKAFEALYLDGEDFEVVANGYTEDDFSYGELQLRCVSPKTEEEKSQELKRSIDSRVREKERRMEEYLKLKKEFEGDEK